MEHRANALRFSLAAVVAGALTGAAVSLIGRAIIGISTTLVDASVAALAFLSFTYALGDIAGLRLPVPSRHWLVPRDWTSWSAKSFSTVFGFFLGAGIFTVVPFVGFYIVLSACAILLGPADGAMIMASFGAMRGLPVLLAAISMRTEQSLGHEAALGIVAGHTLANHSAIRPLRVLSLLCAGTMLTKMLLSGGVP